MAMYQAPPPPKRQKLKSEGVVVEAPMSFTGAYQGETGGRRDLR